MLVDVCEANVKLPPDSANAVGLVCPKAVVLLNKISNNPQAAFRLLTDVLLAVAKKELNINPTVDTNLLTAFLQKTGVVEVKCFMFVNLKVCNNISVK